MRGDLIPPVTVPFLGLGIRPLGPKILANLTNFPICAGVAIKISKSNLPDSMSAMTSSLASTALLALPNGWGRSTSLEKPLS